MNFSTLLAEGTTLLEQELTWVALLSIAALVAIVVRRIRLPYTVALVLVGLALTLRDFGQVEVSSDAILAVLVPPLLFEATLHVKWSSLRRDLVPILLLAVVGSLIGAGLIGLGVNLLLGIPLAAAVAFGALISATDPVAVIAFFRSLGVSKRLALLVEGESLFNDGVAVVLFTLAVSLADSTSGGLNVGEALWTFVQVAFGGLAVGLVLGYIVSMIILKNVDDHLIETTTTVALAFGSFVVAEEFGVIVGIDGLHLSGILAVVAAGIMVGNFGFQNTSPTTKLSLDNFWELVAFVVNSLVFLIIGLEIDITEFGPQLGSVLLAVVLVLLVRALLVYGLAGLNNRVNPRRRIDLPYQHVLYWGGLRGAISLALALTLVPSPGIDPAVGRQLQVMTFGVVLFTLLFQGVTIERVIMRLGLARRPAQQLEQQRRQAQVYARQAGRRELERLRDDGILASNIWQAMADVYDREIAAERVALSEHLTEFPELQQEMILRARADLLQAERSAINDAARRGLISERVHAQLTREMDSRLAALEIVQANRSILRGDGG